MKKILFGMMLSLLAVAACDPVVDDKQAGGVVAESDLKLDVRATTEGGNEIVMTNSTYGVAGQWNYIIGTTAAEKVTAILPFLGEQTITFIGFCDGGTITTTRKVNITQIDHPAAEEWGWFAGTGTEGKRWVWDDEQEFVFGLGGYLGSFIPDWDGFSADDVYESGYEMMFDLNGGPNYTKFDADGEVVEKGTFVFDMNKQKVGGDVGLWAIGQLKFSGASVPNPHFVYEEPESETIYTFDIIELSEDKMVLSCAPDGTGEWEDATFWCFRKK